jgi:hypothetical protein
VSSSAADRPPPGGSTTRKTRGRWTVATKVRVKFARKLRAKGTRYVTFLLDNRNTFRLYGRVQFSSGSLHLGARTFRVGARRGLWVDVRLSKHATAMLRRRGSLRVEVLIRLRDRASTVRRVRRVVRLHPAR